MKKTASAKIYKIMPMVEHDECDIYIGSTSLLYLCQRMAIHKTQYRNFLKGSKSQTKSTTLFQKYGIDNCTIVLIEELSLDDKKLLKSKEKHHISTTPCLNVYHNPLIKRKPVSLI